MWMCGEAGRREARIAYRWALRAFARFGAVACHRIGGSEMRTMGVIRTSGTLKASATQECCLASYGVE
jgi:hypothetical protein